MKHAWNMMRFLQQQNFQNLWKISTPHEIHLYLLLYVEVKKEMKATLIKKTSSTIHHGLPTIMTTTPSIVSYSLYT